MVGVCFVFEPHFDTQNQWDYILSNFKPDKIYVLIKKGDAIEDSNVVGKAERIYSVNDIHNDYEKVLVAPKKGKYFQGRINLLDFKHPDNAVYVFGGNKEHFYVEGVVFDHKVFIPTSTKDEMYNHAACAVVMYDIKSKKWQTK